MTREEALQRLEELDKFRKENCPNMPSVSEFYQDLADAYGLSLEEVTERMMIVGGGVGVVRPIRKK